MRIIAGQHRGRTIQAPPGQNTRPILDRAKTVLFDVLGSRLATPGVLPPVAVLDLFSGSGALGLEALSRGARFCLFVEQNRASAEILRKNLGTLHIIHEAQVIQADASTCDWPVPPTDDGSAGQYGLVFFDPPYKLLAHARPDPLISNILRRLVTSPVIARDAWIVTRHELQPSGGPDLSPLVELERRDVGTMTFRFLSPTAGGGA
jgi:16S rRNA (guanine966-N2)-methyltransferase